MRRILVGVFLLVIVINVVLLLYFVKLQKQRIPSSKSSTLQIKQQYEKLTVATDLPHTKIEFSNQHFLEQYLEQNDFYGFRTIRLFSNPPRGSVQSVTFWLTDRYPIHPLVDYNTEIVNGEKVPTAAMGINYSPTFEHVDVYIYFEDNKLKKLPNIAAAFSYNVILSTLYLKNPIGNRPKYGSLSKVLDSLTNRSFVTVKQ